MAEKPKKSTAKSAQQPVVQTTQESPSKFALVFKIMSVVLILCILIAIGFGVGVYFKFVDVGKIVQDFGLSQHPVVERFFPKTNFETVELREELEEGVKENIVTEQPVSIPPVTANQIQQSPNSASIMQTPNSDIITKEEIEKQAKLKQQEEAKRISKLARLYSGMKPDAAVTIMNELDDATIIAIFNKMEEDQVSKILALFDSKRAARITENMLKGQQQPLRF